MAGRPPSLNSEDPPPPSPSDNDGADAEADVVFESAGEVVDDGKGRVFPCGDCGADLEFHIGAQSLKCPYCGTVKEIDISEDAVIEEQDFHAMLDRLAEQHRNKEPEDEASNEEAANEVKCGSCAGNVVFAGTLTSLDCPWCGSPVQLENVHKSESRIPVDGVLPFLIDKETARAHLDQWVSSRWFAPNEFKTTGARGKFNGVYLAYFTYDSLTFTQYSGQRGQHYYVTVGSGDNKRQERRTRWYPASGRFQRFFDDVLVLASTGFNRKFMQALEPWPLQKVVPFNQEMLAGRFARTYDMELNVCFDDARGRIDTALDRDVRQRIGGDTQRVHSIDTRYDNITFKHLLLPVWLLAYRYREKTFQVFINAGTGEVQGERPWSVLKITMAVMAALAVVGTIVYFYNQ